MNPNDPIEFRLLLYQVCKLSIDSVYQPLGMVAQLRLKFKLITTEKIDNHREKLMCVLLQAVDDVVSDRYPLSLSEALYLAGLRAQVVLGPYSDRIDLVDYE